MSASPTPADARAVALYLTGFAAFIGLYLPQPILPLLGRDFGVGVQQASLVISVTILGIGLAAPLVGALSDRFGRKRLLVGSAGALCLVTLGCAFAPSFGLLIALRFAQGVLLPGLFAVGLTYVSEALPRTTMNTVAGFYIAATVVGGMLGRVLGGALADVADWRYGFGLSALLYVGVVALWIRLPALAGGTRRKHLGTALSGTFGHFKNRAIVSGLLVGFFLFFAFQATFTYLPFRLEQPPFSLSNTLIGLTYLTYTTGIFASGSSGWLRRRLELRVSFVVGFLLAVTGNLITLAPHVPTILLGLLVLCFGNFLVQGLAVGFVATATENDRAGANALYLLLYYLGGSLGAFLPGYLFPVFGYGGVIAAAVAALLLGLLSAVTLTGARASSS